GSQHSGCNLVGESPIAVGERGDRRVQGCGKRGSGANGGQHREGRLPRGPPSGAGQPSIPVVGLEGTAISRRGIRPARYGSRPASTASRIAAPIATGSVASAIPVF